MSQAKHPQEKLLHPGKDLSFQGGGCDHDSLSACGMLWPMQLCQSHISRSPVAAGWSQPFSALTREGASMIYCFAA